MSRPPRLGRQRHMTDDEIEALSEWVAANEHGSSLVPAQRGRAIRTVIEGAQPLLDDPPPVVNRTDDAAVRAAGATGSRSLPAAHKGPPPVRRDVGPARDAAIRRAARRHREAMEAGVQPHDHTWVVVWECPEHLCCSVCMIDRESHIADRWSVKQAEEVAT